MGSSTTTAPRANAAKTAGNFWWADLSSTDDAAAADFYGRIFGWEWEVSPLGGGMVHRNGRLGEHMVAGIDPVMPGSGMPTAWTNFVFTDDIDATAARAAELGANVVMAPFDVMGEGHMAVLLDPTGAAFGLWQPGRHTGADAVNQPGTYTWTDLATDDVAAARRFYGELFGWGWEEQQGAEMEYWMATLAGRTIAGIFAKPEQFGDMPNNWATYFGVADVEAAASEVKAAGGSIVFGPARMGPGTGVGARDPQGGYFVAYQLDEWPAD